MDKKILNYPDLDLEEVRYFIRLCTNVFVRLRDGHHVVTKGIDKEFKAKIPTESQQKISTILESLDVAIATSVVLRDLLFVDLKYYRECEKRQRREKRERKKREREMCK